MLVFSIIHQSNEYQVEIDENLTFKDLEYYIRFEMDLPPTISLRIYYDNKFMKYNPTTILTEVAFNDCSKLIVEYGKLFNK